MIEASRELQLRPLGSDLPVSERPLDVFGTLHMPFGNHGSSE